MNVVFQKTEYYLTLASEGIDLIAFQNIVIGVLILFIFIGELIFQDLKSKKNKSEFSKMVLLSKVFNLKHIAIATLGSLFLFSFAYLLDGWLKFVYLVLIAILVIAYLFWRISKFNNWLHGRYHDFEIKFLKTFDKCNDLKKTEIQIRAWRSLWSERVNYKESEFFNIFAKQVDFVISDAENKQTVELSKCYLFNIEKRDVFLIGQDVFPKVLSWAESTMISSKNAYFFQDEFLVKLEIFMLSGNSSTSISGYQFFSTFENYIDDAYKRLNLESDKALKDKFNAFLGRLFSNIISTYFNKELFLNNENLLNDFPSNWKLQSENKDNWQAHTVFKDLIRFINVNQPIIFQSSNNSDFNQSISKLINGLFPKVDSILFVEFFTLYFASFMVDSSSMIDKFLSSKSNFVVINSVTTWADVDNNNYENKVDALFDEQRKETARVIDVFFINSRYIEKWPAVYSNDLIGNFSELKDSERAIALNNARLDKLKNIRIELKKVSLNDDKEAQCRIKRLIIIFDLIIDNFEKVNY